MKKKPKKTNFYSLDKILKINADYNIIFGQRSNGKTYGTLKYCLEQYSKYKKQFVYLRRYSEDVKPKKTSTLFNPFEGNGEFKKIFPKYDGIRVVSNRFHLCKITETKTEIKTDLGSIIGYSMSLSEMEHNKSTSYPEVKNIIFDEFISTNYFHDEFRLFTNTLSTIIRLKTDVKIFMLGNTVNQYCDYFQNMGLKHIRDQEQGTIETYSLGTDCRIAVEYCGQMESNESQNKYFCFDDETTQMITKGSWEVSKYPTLSDYKKSFTSDQVLFSFFIEFDDIIYKCLIVNNDSLFIFISKKVMQVYSPKESNSLIYTLRSEIGKNIHRNLLKPILKVHRKIYNLFKNEMIFYSDNKTGEAIQNYINVIKH